LFNTELQRFGIEDQTLVTQTVWYYLQGGAGILFPLWFIPMMMLFFLCAPLFIWLDKKQVYYWLLPLSIVISVFIHRPSPLWNTLHHFGYFFSAYLFGMFCSHHNSQLINWAKRYFWFLLALFITLLAINVQYYDKPGNIFVETPFDSSKGLIGINYLHKLVSCLLLMSFFHRTEAIASYGLNTLAELSFGIFYVHAYFLFIIRRGFDSHSPLRQAELLSIEFVLTSAFITLGCVLSLRFVQYLFPKRSRLLIGC
jgi:hypothetical protein